VRHSELWERLNHHLGRGYAQVWSETQVLAALRGRTVAEALAAGDEPKSVWRAVHAALELPARDR
jgi:hypothetical protein